MKPQPRRVMAAMSGHNALAIFRIVRVQWEDGSVYYDAEPVTAIGIAP